MVLVRIQEVLQTFCLNFQKMNRCHYLLEAVVIIPLFPHAGLICETNIQSLIFTFANFLYQLGTPAQSVDFRG